MQSRSREKPTGVRKSVTGVGTEGTGRQDGLLGPHPPTLPRCLTYCVDLEHGSLTHAHHPTRLIICP